MAALVSWFPFYCCVRIKKSLTYVKSPYGQVLQVFGIRPIASNCFPYALVHISYVWVGESGGKLWGIFFSNSGCWNQEMKSFWSLFTILFSPSPFHLLSSLPPCPWLFLPFPLPGSSFLEGAGTSLHSHWWHRRGKVQSRGQMSGIRFPKREIMLYFALMLPP